jgi:Protein of unknown function (DUF2752)
VSIVFVQPAPPATRGRRMLAPAASIGALSLLTLALHARDPHQHGSWGLCPSAMMGIYCPGCGGLRAVNDLTHGDVGAALSSNVVVTVLIPVGVVLLAIWAVDRWRGHTRRVPWQRLRPLVVAMVAVLVAFTVARNTGAGAWLAP